MPYEWTAPPADPAAPGDTGPVASLVLWPHQSMTPRGFAIFISATALMLALPLLAVVGSPVLWGLLLFFIPVLAGVWFAIMRNKGDRAMHEELTLWPDRIELEHAPPRGPVLKWRANPYWVSVHLSPEGGRVENYLTLKGAGREVELGAFLSPQERVALKEELELRLAEIKAAQA